MRPARKKREVSGCILDRNWKHRRSSRSVRFAGMDGQVSLRL